jgi:redox-sensitive bicupin YhaK (pirin superfamily)
MAAALAKLAETNSKQRAITHRTRGHRHGPITRLMSPSDLGEVLKPFIFLDLFEADRIDGPGFAPHPHSGIATLTLFLKGGMTYADTTGKEGSLRPGAIEWMRAGKGVWHAGEPTQGQPMGGYQLWLALPPQLELADPESIYVEPETVAGIGSVRVALGDYDGATGVTPLPFPITYLHVRLRDGQRWTYTPGADHDVAFLALNSGKLHTASIVLERELAVFAEGNAEIELVAEGDVELVIGSARKHPHPLVSGHYSVHTNADALAQGERTIAELGKSARVAALKQR